MVDRKAAAEFLELLERDGDFTFQTFAEGEQRTRRTDLGRVFHGTVAEHATRLADLNNAGAGVFVMINEGDGETKDGAKTCRTAANVIRVRALFVDLDGAPITPVLRSALPPDWVVQSSPGKWHAYWSVQNCPLSEFSAAQASLAKRFDGDPAVSDLPRVMRVPGFVHRKGAPFTSGLYLPSAYPTLLGDERE